jgi:hypothetical protein
LSKNQAGLFVFSAVDELEEMEVEKWDTFFTNGRPYFHKNCLLLCDVIFESDKAVDCSFWENSHSYPLGIHIEVEALKRIIEEEEQAGTPAR